MPVDSTASPIRVDVTNKAFIGLLAEPIGL
jgi:hypothetical protein